MARAEAVVLIVLMAVLISPSACARGLLGGLNLAGNLGGGPLGTAPRTVTSTSSTSNAKATGDIAGAGSFSYSNKYVSVSASDSFSANIPSALDGKPDPTVSRATGTVAASGDNVVTKSYNQVTPNTAVNVGVAVAYNIPNSQSSTGPSTYTSSTTCVDGPNCLKN